MSKRRIDSQNPLVGDVWDDLADEGARRINRGAQRDAQAGRMSYLGSAAISIGTALVAPYIASKLRQGYNYFFPKDSTSKETQKARQAGKKAIRDLAGLPAGEKDYLGKKAKTETSSQGTYTRVDPNSTAQFTVVSPSEVDRKNDVYRNAGGENINLI